MTRAMQSITIYFVKGEDFVKGDFKADEIIRNMRPKFK
jgi:hypothetical protein